MPKGCNGLILIDKSLLAYSKLNCKWGTNPRGPTPLTQVISLNKRKTIEKAVRVCLTINADVYNFIHKQAIHKTSQTGENFTSNDLIREALSTAFPAPKQLDMFGEKKR
jgi:hypothetical protein